MHTSSFTAGGDSTSDLRSTLAILCNYANSEYVSSGGSEGREDDGSVICCLPSLLPETGEHPTGGNPLHQTRVRNL